MTKDNHDLDVICKNIKKIYNLNKKGKTTQKPNEYLKRLLEAAITCIEADLKINSFKDDVSEDGIETYDNVVLNFSAYSEKVKADLPFVISICIDYSMDSLSACVIETTGNVYSTVSCKIINLDDFIYVFFWQLINATMSFINMYSKGNVR